MFSRRMLYVLPVFMIALSLGIFVGLTNAGQSAQEADTYTVLVGAGRDTDAITAYLPETIRVTVGDTIIWNINSDELHTVTFFGPDGPPPLIVPIPEDSGAGPGIMVNPAVGFPTRLPDAPVETHTPDDYFQSGTLSVIPPNPESFEMVFDTPGIYRYVCSIHPPMRGAVIVEEAGVAVASPEEVAEQVAAEEAGFLAQVDAAEEMNAQPGSFENVDGSTTWQVAAGVTFGGDVRVNAYAFSVEDLTISVGDTVIWTSTDFHTVTFDDGPPPPELIVPVFLDDGPPLLTLPADAVAPFKPSQIYDPSQYFSSGAFGQDAPGPESFSLTFTEPGVFEYFCTVHRELGMEGTITVVEG